jgi:hypothetical protein
MQKIIILYTQIRDFRDRVISMKFENGDALDQANIEYANRFPDGIPFEYVGFIGSGDFNPQMPETPLHALGNGWKLMAPPIGNPNVADVYHKYEWWFVIDW